MPEEIRPFPQAAPREPGQLKRKAGKSLIYTSTPVKKMLEDSKAKRKLDHVLESSSDSDSDNVDDQIICDESSDISMCSKQGGP